MNELDQLDAGRRTASGYHRGEPKTCSIKVKTRLTANEEYRSLQNRVRDAEAGLAVGSATTAEADTVS